MDTEVGVVKRRREVTPGAEELASRAVSSGVVLGSMTSVELELRDFEVDMGEVSDQLARSGADVTVREMGVRPHRIILAVLQRSRAWRRVELTGAERRPAELGDGSVDAFPWVTRLGQVFGAMRQKKSDLVAAFFAL